ncbi:MAG: glycosyltransferase family 4 protein [Magnetococcales bacterium]|nr:glycosyltransferase family 4 protein [Magnetococcales bacterium]NGZ25801.1 glycosyltransferase family 4 protein [Magnetococcales bacterium]
MNVLFTVSNFKNNLLEAASNSIVKLARELKNKQADTTLLIPGPPTPSNMDEVTGLSWISFTNESDYHSRVRVLKNIMAMGRFWRSWPLTREPEIIHFHLGNLLEMFLLRLFIPKRRHGLRVATIWQPYLGVGESLRLPWQLGRLGGLFHHYLFNSWLHWPLYWFGALFFHHLVVASHFQKKQLSFLDPARVTVITNGVADPGPRKRPFLATEPAILYLGHATPIKGLAVLFHALAAIRDHQSFTLTLAMSDFGCQKTIMNQVAQAGLTDRVIFKGEVDSFQEMHNHDLLVLPLRASVGTACFPNVALEALATGLPMVASRVDSLAELIQHGKTGILVPPNDTTALADAILDLLRSPDHLTTMSQKQRSVFLEKYTLAAFVENHAALYRRLLSESSPVV